MVKVWKGRKKLGKALLFEKEKHNCRIKEHGK
jgi:hypothetical protein